MKKLKFKHLFGLIAILYPLLVFCVLVVFKLPIRYLSIGIIIFAIAYSVVNSRHYKGRHTLLLFISPVILCTIGVISLYLDDSPIIIKLYPALADLAYLTIMVTSFFFPPPLAYYFINIFDKSIKTKIPKARFDVYCVRASVVWCVYFVIDGITALLTAYFSSDFVWGVYNGGITYAIMGLIFAGEFVILKMKVKKYSLLYNNAEISTEVAPEEGEDVNS